MKVALLEASHWHVPLYLEPLEAPGIEVVAVSDAEQVKGQAIAARFGSTLYSSSYELLDRERVDFAFAFGRHSEMPALAEADRKSTRLNSSHVSISYAVSCSKKHNNV